MWKGDVARSIEAYHRRPVWQEERWSMTGTGRFVESKRFGLECSGCSTQCAWAHRWKRNASCSS